jgi:ABC-type Na+ efflux pump permease subunit
MHPDPRKIAVVAATEFGSAIRARSFLVMLLLLPVIMGGSVVLQLIVAKRVDTKPRKVAVVDRTGSLYVGLEKAAGTFNSQSIDAAGKPVRCPHRKTASPRPFSSCPTAFAVATLTPSW